MTGKPYARALIRGALTVKSALHLGAGREEVEVDEDGQTRRYNEVCLDDNGRPYLPGSSLRGLLSALCERLDPCLRLSLFGSGRDEGGGGRGSPDGASGAIREDEAANLRGYGLGKDEGGGSGRLRVFDLPLKPEPPPVCPGVTDLPRRTRCAIDPVTGTALDRHLFSHAHVPGGSRFALEIEVDETCGAELEALLGILHLLDGQRSESRLGQGANKLLGLLRWEPGEVRCLSREKLAEWLKGGAVCRRSLDACYEAAIFRSHAYALSNPDWLELRLVPASPILINDPERIPVPKQEGDPDLIHHRDEHGNLLIPGSTLLGALRGRCRRILLTVATAKSPGLGYERHKTIADGLLGELFGTKDRAGAIRFGDALAVNTTPHRQTFNAVDRFTGGVARGALYTVEAATADYLDARLRLHRARLDGDWWKGLLLYALRDAMEGDFAVGWGKSKGYGRFRLAFKQPEAVQWTEDWRSLLSLVSEHQVRQWAEAFDDRINEEISRAISQPNTGATK